MGGLNFQQAAFIRSFGLAEQLPASQKKEIVFCGRSNVGKSTLINRLCSRKSLARVSSTPGKTTTINFFSLGDEYILVDLPGYGYAKRSKQEKQRWASLLDHYFTSDRPIALVVLLLDSRHHPSEDDETMLNFLCETHQRFMCIATKTDKLKVSQLAENLKNLNEQVSRYGSLVCVPFSALRSTDATIVRTAIEERISKN